METHTASNESGETIHHPSDDLLMYLAERNVKFRKNLIAHVIAWVAVGVYILIMATTTVAFVTASATYTAIELETGMGAIPPVPVRPAFELETEMGAIPPVPARPAFELETEMGAIPPVSSRSIAVANATSTNSASPNLPLVFVAGLWTAWALVIAKKVYVLIISNAKDKRRNFDPIAAEYNRLKAASPEKLGFELKRL